MVTLSRRDRIRAKLDENRRATFLGRIGRAIDETVFSLAPSWGERRLAARRRRELHEERALVFEERLEQLRNWGGEDDDRLRGHRWRLTGDSPNAAIEDYLEIHQNKCSDLARTNGIARSAIDGRTAYEIGTGITGQPRIRERAGVMTRERAKSLNGQIEEVMRLWSLAGVDRSRKLSLPMFQRQVNRCYATYGEAFVLFGLRPLAHGSPIGTVLQLISPERVSTPPGEEANPLIRMGVEFNANNEVIAYHIRSEHPGDDKEFEYRWDRIERWSADGQPRIVHIYDPIFPEQARAVPWLAAALNRILDLEDAFEAELIAKQVEACFGLVVTSNNEFDSPQDEADARSEPSANRRIRHEDIRPGSVNYANDGESVQVVDPSRPGATFAPLVERSLRLIAGALQMPYEVLAKDFFRTTYSSGRLGMLDGHIGFEMRRQSLIHQFLVWLWKFNINEAVFLAQDDSFGTPMLDIDLSEYLANRSLFEAHHWQPPPRAAIDREKEENANAKGMENETTARSEVLGEKGADLDAHEDLLVEEGQRAIERRVKLRLYQQQLEERFGLEPETQPDEGDDKNQRDNERQKSIEKKLEALASQVNRLTEELVAA